MSSAEPSRLHVPLEKPPQALNVTVRRLLGKVLAGEIRVPDFQRPLRWQASDVVKLFDSILKGYPIGSLLLWKKSAPAEPNLVIGSAKINAPPVDGAWYIVDGQQRITALAASLLDLNHGQETRWTVRFDPISNKFLSGPAPLAMVSQHVPASALGDLRRLSRWLRSCSLDEATQSRLEEVQQTLLDYEIPAYLMDTEDPKALMGVFARLNSTGVRMRPDEVFHALFGARARSQGPLDLAELQTACDLDGFGEPPRADVMRAVLAMSGQDPSRQIEDMGDDALAQVVGTETAREALQRTVAFLQAPPNAEEPGAGIPAYRLLPYPVVFVILARWFHAFPESEPNVCRELSRWLWRGVVTGVHHRAAVSEMRFQVRRIVPNNLEQSLRNLTASAREPERVDWTLNQFHGTNAASRVEILALLSQTPRDLNGPVSIRALLSASDRLAIEVFRKTSKQPFDEELRPLLKTIANRVLLDGNHPRLGSEFARWSPKSDAQALESHLINKEAHKALKQGDVKAFLLNRAARIRIEVSKFLTLRAGLGQPRLRPVETYLEDASDDLHEDKGAPL